MKRLLIYGDSYEEVHGIRGDATNTAVHMNTKVHVCEVSSIFNFGDVKTLDPNPPDIPASTEWMRMWSTLEHVPTPCNDVGSRALFRKQGEVLGLKWYNEFDQRLEPDIACYKHLKVFVFGTDQGGDQVGCHNVMENETRTMPNVIYIRSWCCRHQNQLCTGKQLKRLQKGLTWRTLAKAINTWRQQGGAKKMLTSYADAFTMDRAREVLRSVPTRPIKGRWGAVWKSAKYFLECGWNELALAFGRAFVDPDFMEKNKKAKARAAREVLFQMDPDEESYAEHNHRYAQDAWLEMCTFDFWAGLTTLYYTAEPAEHLDNWLKQTHKAGNTANPAMFEFVTLRAEKFYTQWEDLLFHSFQDTWPRFYALLTDAVWAPTDQSDISDAIADAVSHALERSANYYFRFLRRTRSYPCLILFFILSPPDESCWHRKTIANDILTGAMVDPQVAKLKALFEEDLKEAAEHGTCTKRLWDLITAISRVWASDTEEIEGANNVIKAICKSSPSLAHKLLWARVMIKKMLQCLDKDDHKAAIEQCANMHHDVKELQRTSDYSALLDTVDATNYPVCPSIRPAKDKDTDKDNKCAAVMIRNITAGLREIERTACVTASWCLNIRLGEGGPDTTFFLSLKHGCVWWCTMAVWDVDSVELVRPLTQFSLLGILAELHNEWTTWLDGRNDDIPLCTFCVSCLPLDWTGSLEAGRTLACAKVNGLDMFSMTCRCARKPRRGAGGRGGGGGRGRGGVRGRGRGRGRAAGDGGGEHGEVDGDAGAGDADGAADAAEAAEAEEDAAAEAYLEGHARDDAVLDAAGDDDDADAGGGPKDGPADPTDPTGERERELREAAAAFVLEHLPKDDTPREGDEKEAETEVIHALAEDDDLDFVGCAYHIECGGGGAAGEGGVFGGEPDPEVGPAIAALKPLLRDDEPEEPAPLKPTTVAWVNNVTAIVDALEWAQPAPRLDRCISLVYFPDSAGEPRKLAWIFWDDSNDASLLGRVVVLYKNMVQFTPKSWKTCTSYGTTLSEGRMTWLVLQGPAGPAW